MPIFSLFKSKDTKQAERLVKIQKRLESNEDLYEFGRFEKYCEASNADAVRMILNFKSTSDKAALLEPEEKHDAIRAAFWAALNRDDDNIVSVLFESAIEYLNFTINHIYLAAAERGRLSIIQYCAKSPDFKLTSSFVEVGQNSLMLAIEGRHHDCVLYLLDKYPKEKTSWCPKYLIDMCLQEKAGTFRNSLHCDYEFTKALITKGYIDWYMLKDKRDSYEGRVTYAGGMKILNKEIILETATKINPLLVALKGVEIEDRVEPIGESKEADGE